MVWTVGGCAVQEDISPGGSSGSTGTGAAAGASAVGGTSGTGASTNSGGTTASGGATASGSATASGGTAGGSTSSGGATASGGTASGSGGTTGSVGCGGANTFKVGASCYKRSAPDGSVTATWVNANTACESWGGTLATLTSQSEIDAVRQNLGINTGEAWIGLNDREAEGTYVWVSGETSDFTNWENGTPSGGDANDCVAIGANYKKPPSSVGQWNEVDCAGSKPYFCEKAVP